jgi:hypothetical protein
MVWAALNFGNGLHAIVDVKFSENLMQVVLYGVRTDAQNAAYFGIGFALLYPIHYFDFALTQSTAFVSWLGRQERGHISALRQGRYPAQGSVKIW